MSGKSKDTLFAERKLKASASTDPVEKGRGDQAPRLSSDDNEILDRVWDEIAREDAG